MTKNTVTSSPMPIVKWHTVTLFLGQHNAPDTVQSAYIDIHWEEIFMSIYRYNGEVRDK